jgi:hypothetical protein
MTASTDPSLRFVLPEESPYLRNLAALWKVEPKLARLIDALPDAHPGYEIERSKSGDPTVKVQTAGGGWAHLHSRYQPADEAARLVDALKIDETVACFVQGLGLGYHAQTLFERAGDEVVICIFENDLRMIRLAMEHRDLSAILESPRVLWLWEANKGELFTRLAPWQASVTMGMSCITHSPSVQRCPEFHDQMKTFVEEFQAYAQTSVTTLVLNGKRTAENVAANIPWYVATPSLSRLEKRFANMPAIIVSAGPSLRKNKHLLKDAVGKAVIIAVQTTLQPLLEMGIEPNFVTSLDYHDISTRFWEKLPPNLSTELIAEPKAASAIFDLNPGPLSLLGNEFADNLLSEMKLGKIRLPSGATVAHLAYYVAEHLGCNPIIFIGQDLGFSDGLCYTPGTSYEDVWRPELGRFCTLEMKQWEQIVRDRNILRKVPDYQGRPMYTESRLYTYLQHFERDFSRTRTRIIDATEGGVLKRGATPMRLIDAIHQFCTHELPTKRIEHPGMRWDRVRECGASLLNRRREAADIERIGRETLPLLEEVRDHLTNQARVNKAIGRIDALRAKMSEFGACYQLIMQLSQNTELERYKADRKISASKVDGVEKQRRQVQRDIANVQHVVDASVEFQRLMDLTLERLDRFAAEYCREAA